MMKGPSFFRIAWTALMVIATSAPYLFNWFSAPPGHHYTWILPPYPADSFGYIAWAQQAVQGEWLFRIKYTALPHHAFLFHPFFLICGWVSALLSCDVGVVFWVVKALGVVIFFASFYRYVDYLGLGRFAATTASILVGVSSGIGGILATAGWIKTWPVISADLWMPEVTTFFALLWNPLFPFSLTLILLSIYWFDRGSNEGRTRDLWLSGLAAGVLTLIHPYALPLLLAWSASVAIVRARLKAIAYLSRYLAAVLPFAIYVASVSWLDPIVGKHSALGAMKSPSLASYAIGFGLPLLLCIAGLVVGRRTLLAKYWHLILWFFLSVALAYAPFWFQRKLIFGAHIPLCIIAAIALDIMLTKWTSARRRKWVLVGAAAILLPVVATTPLYLMVSQREKVRANEDGSYFLSGDMTEALKALKQRSKPTDVVFATVATSRLIPAFSGNTTVWGHWAMSVDQKERASWLDDLFTKVDDLNRSPQFWSNDIQFIFADGAFKQLLEQSPFAWGAILRDARKVFENDTVVIYQRQSTP
jgi:hypothetical protein